MKTFSPYSKDFTMHKTQSRMVIRFMSHASRQFLLFSFLLATVFFSQHIFANQTFANQNFTNQVKESTSILLLGDSLSASLGMKESEGWVSLLNNQLTQKHGDKKPYSIINASISGETTAGGLARLGGILTKNKYDYLLIELGGNDGLRGFPPKLIKNNLLQIITLAKQQNVHVILMDIRIPPNYGKRYNQLFNNVFKQASADSDIPLMPFFMEQIAVKPEFMQADGIHPNKAAQSTIVKFVHQQLIQTLSVK